VRDRARRRSEEEVAARPPGPSRPVPGSLDLLRQAGNQATVRALARAPKTAARQDMVVIDGIGELPVVSFLVKPQHAISVTLESGAADAQLQQLSLSGAPIATVTLKVVGHTETLSDAVVSELKFGGGGNDGGPPLITVEFTGRSLEFK
jgi:hypothetical protein